MTGLALSTIVALSIATTLGVTTVVVAFMPAAPPGARRVVVRWRRRRLVGAGLGMICGAMVAGVAIWFLGADRGGSAVWVVIADAAAGGLIGIAATPFRPTKAAETGTRVARSEHTPLARYASVQLRWAVRVVGAIALVALMSSVVVGVARERYDGFTSPVVALAFVADPPIMLGLLGVTGWVLFEVRGPLTVARSRSTPSSDDLAVDEHLRRQSVRDLALAAITLGLAGVLFTIPLVALGAVAGPSDDPFRLTIAIATALAAGAIVFRPALIRAATAVTTRVLSVSAE